MRYCPKCFAPSPDEQATCACGVDLDARGISFGTSAGTPRPPSTMATVVGVGSGIYWLTLLREMTRPGSRFGNDDVLLALLVLLFVPMLAVSVAGAADAVDACARGAVSE
jgi:hypothetical protein